MRWQIWTKRFSLRIICNVPDKEKYRLDRELSTILLFPVLCFPNLLQRRINRRKERMKRTMEIVCGAMD